MPADSLADAGYRVIEAENADEALTVLADCPDTRVVITDVRMHGSLDGIELAHVVSQRCLDAAIVVVSGHARPQEGDLPAGARFIPKPYILSEIRTVVSGLIGRTTSAKVMPALELVQITKVS